MAAVCMKGKRVGNENEGQGRLYELLIGNDRGLGTMVL